MLGAGKCVGSGISVADEVGTGIVVIGCSGGFVSSIRVGVNGVGFMGDTITVGDIVGETSGSFWVTEAGMLPFGEQSLSALILIT